MNTVALSGTLRKAVGTKDAAQLRREKRVPCVLYGGENTVHFSVDEAALRKVVFTPEVNGVELDIDGNKTLAMVQEKQFHPLTDRMMHIDFLLLDPSKETAATLSVRLVGQPAGVRKGGKLSQPMRKVRVKGLPGKLPGHLEVNVADLDVNQSVKIADLKVDGLTFIDRPSNVVVAVKMTKKEQAAEAAAAPAKGAAPAKAAPAKK
ncbi:MAG TPA: 50S ribosomal protein L25 [Flavobacteriales bacterium]|nr:50S ribosomal protein L25 [Flavobacteriales bacterium]